MNLLKNIFPIKSQNKKLLEAIKYPERIIIESYQETDIGVWLRAYSLSIIEITDNNSLIGNTVLQLLNFKFAKIKYAGHDYKTSNEEYKRITGLKSNTMQMKNALCVVINKTGDSIKLIPTINGGPKGINKGFHHINDLSVSINEINNAEEIGSKVLDAWKYCK